MMNDAFPGQDRLFQDVASGHGFNAI